MEGFSKYAKEQYKLVRESRKVLLEYCRTISPGDFIHENSSFGRGGSIRNLLTHIANIYEFWIAKHALGKAVIFTSYNSIQTVNQVVDLFDTIDIVISEFIDLFENSQTQIDYEINGIKSNATPLKLFTHVITHEFHHKGQILSISRHLGYTPIDTDIIR